MTCECEQCGRQFERPSGSVKYRRKLGIVRMFCTQACFGLNKRTSKAAKVALKAEYDRKYRETNAESMRIKKAAYFQAHRNPEKEAEVRRKRLHQHRAYIAKYNADPKNKAAKKAYDESLRASEYGDFAESFRLLLDLEREIRQRCPDKYERLKARGYFERANEKRKERRRQEKETRCPTRS